MLYIIYVEHNRYTENIYELNSITLQLFSLFKYVFYLNDYTEVSSIKMDYILNS